MSAAALKFRRWMIPLRARVMAASGEHCSAAAVQHINAVRHGAQVLARPEPSVPGISRGSEGVAGLMLGECRSALGMCAVRYCRHSLAETSPPSAAVGGSEHGERPAAQTFKHGAQSQFSALSFKRGSCALVRVCCPLLSVGELLPRAPHRAARPPPPSPPRGARARGQRRRRPPAPSPRAAAPRAA